MKLVSTFLPAVHMIFGRVERDFKSRVWDFNLGMVGDEDLSFNFLWLRMYLNVNMSFVQIFENPRFCC